MPAPTSSHTTTTSKADWLIPAGLVALGIVPVLAGGVRVMQLSAGGADVTAENARFFAAPWPVVLHIACVVVYCLLGALQFAPALRRRHLAWHRWAGRWLLVPCGLGAALTGLWMTQFYPNAAFDGHVLYAIRLVVGTAMAVCICLGVAAIRRRDIAQHQAWMMRGYALGLGAGTQVLTHLPWVFFPGIQGEASRTLFMAAGWVINIAVAEWLIARGRGRRLLV